MSHKVQKMATWRFATRQKVDQKHHYTYTYLTLIGLTKFIAEVGVGRLNTPVPEQRYKQTLKAELPWRWWERWWGQSYCSVRGCCCCCRNVCCVVVVGLSGASLEAS